MIAHDSSANKTQTGSTTATFPHTCTGDNLILFVAAHVGNSGDVVTSVTYNSVAMTRAGTYLSANSESTYLYYLLNPASGAHDVVVTMTLGYDVRCLSASYTGALQSSQPDDYDTNSSGSAANITTISTTVADNCWVVSAALSSGGVPAAGTGTTLRNNTANYFSIGDSNGPKTPAGAYSMQWTISPDGWWNVVQASFKPAAETTTSTSTSTSTTSTSSSTSSSTSTTTSTSTTSTSSSTSTTSTSSSTSTTTSSSSSTSTTSTSTTTTYPYHFDVESDFQATRGEQFSVDFPK